MVALGSKDASISSFLAFDLDIGSHSIEIPVPSLDRGLGLVNSVVSAIAARLHRGAP